MPNVHGGHESANRACRRRIHYYPDVVVTCSQQDNNPSAPAHYVIEPSLIVEVLLPRTEAIDRREKLLAYAHLPSLKEYLLVDSQSQRVEIYRKNETYGWNLEIPNLDEKVTLTAIGLELTYADIYEDSDVEPCKELTR